MLLPRHSAIVSTEPITVPAKASTAQVAFNHEVARLTT
jgi:hypothetical protein